MKKIQKILFTLLLTVFCFSLWNIPVNGASPSVQLWKIYINKGKKIKIPHTGKITWVSKDKTVAIVDSNGNITAKKLDNLYISPKYNTNTKNIQVFVIDSPTSSTSLKFSKTSLKMKVADKQIIKYTIVPSNSTDIINAYTDKTNIIAVESNVNGALVVEAKAVGTASLTIMSSSGKISTMKITVSKNDGKNSTQFGVNVPLQKQSIDKLDIIKYNITASGELAKTPDLQLALIANNNYNYNIDWNSLLYIECYDKNNQLIETKQGYFNHILSNTAFVKNNNNYNMYVSIPSNTTSFKLTNLQTVPSTDASTLLAGSTTINGIKFPKKSSKLDLLTLSNIDNSKSGTGIIYLKNNTPHPLKTSKNLTVITYNNNGEILRNYVHNIEHLLPNETYKITISTTNVKKVDLMVNGIEQISNQFFIKKGTTAYGGIKLPNKNTELKVLVTDYNNYDSNTQEFLKAEKTFKILKYSINKQRNASTNWLYKSDLYVTIQNTSTSELSCPFLFLTEYDSNSYITNFTGMYKGGIIVDGGNTNYKYNIGNGFLNSDKIKAPASMSMYLQSW